VGFIFIFTELE